MLKLAKNLELPISAVTQTFAFLGKRGGGKTYGASKLAELMLAIGAQIIALDVVGTWYGLRVPKNEKGKAFDILVFGGLNGDIEINPKAGKIVAGIILEKHLSAVVDISQFVQSEQMRFAYDFLITLFEGRKKQPGACHVFLEESQELVPQNLPKSDSGFGAKMLNAGERLVKLGRNFGIGCTLISQRPQEVNKKVLNQTEVLLAFQMTGIQERKTIREWVRDKGDETDVEQLLPKLETGQALIWSPTWLKISGTYKIAEKITADVSATPEVGATEIRANTLAKVDVAELRESIGALTAEMEANTPAALKKRIGELERDLAASQKNEENITNNIPVAEPIEVPIVFGDDLAILKQFPQEMRGEIAGYCEQAIKQLGERLESWTRLSNNLIDRIEAKLPHIDPSVARISTSNEGPKHAMQAQSSRKIDDSAHKQGQIGQNETKSLQNLKSHANSSLPLAHVDILDKLSRPQKKLLDVLASFRPLGTDSLDKSTLAVFADVSPRSSSFANNLSALRTASNLGGEPLIEYLPGGKVCLTDIGRNFADGAGFTASSNEDLLDAWCTQLRSGPQSNILRRLFAIYPSQISRGDLADNVGVSETSSSFANNLSRLRTLGLIDYGSNKTVFATKMLFPF